MAIRPFSLVVAGLIAIAALTGPAFGFDKKKKAPPPEKHETVITNVTANAITITDSKTTKTLTVTQFTEINVNGQRATMSDLNPGMTVSVILGTDPTRASRISAVGKK
jgi:hypothetical protein